MYMAGQETQTAANVFRELPSTQRMSVAPTAAEVTLLWGCYHSIEISLQPAGVSC